MRRDDTLKISGLNLHVTQWGPADGWPVLMLHGIRGYAETFAGLAQALQPGRRVIAFDQRGRGQSDWDPAHDYYTQAYVQDLEGVVDRLGLERFDLLGHSMGGINAIVYAGRHPQKVRRLIIEDAGPGAFDVSEGAARIQRELATTPAQFPSWEAASDFMRRLRPSVTEQARQQRLEKMLKPDAQGGYTWRYDHAGISATRIHPDPSRVVDLEPSLRSIACPTLVLRGGRSDYLQPSMVERMRQWNPHIVSAEVPDAGHYIHDDQPARVARLVVDFLGEEEPPR